MTGSLRLRLFAALLLATGIVWLAAVVWIAVGSRREVERVLDTRLQEAARMVVSLVTDLDHPSSTTAEGRPAQLGSYERQLSCQVWSLDGRLIARSSGAPDRKLSEAAPGFSERTIDGETWRVFTAEDAGRNVRVMVGDRLGLRERLVTDLIKGVVWPALLIAPLLGAVIWLSLGRGLRPLRRMARDLAQRDADDMRPVDATHAPVEVRPLADALNGLFGKVEAARAHERTVTAFAAHELRTPLAGLKTQAQVALAARDPDTVREALGQIILAVDRSSRLVRQLLALARVDAQERVPATDLVAPAEVLQRVIAGVPSVGEITVAVSPDAQVGSVRTNAEYLELALRNLHENAVQHAVPGGSVRWRLNRDGLTVENDGPTIPEDEVARLGTRFFRGRNRHPTGSGLGLAIAKAALAKIGARLSIDNREDRTGVVCSVTLGSDEAPVAVKPA
ncbi:ATP-binding protein [Methylobacterium sp. C33D]